MQGRFPGGNPEARSKKKAVITGLGMQEPETHPACAPNSRLRTPYYDSLLIPETELLNNHFNFAEIFR